MSDSDLTREDIAALAGLLADVRDDVADAATAFRQVDTRESPLTRQLEEIALLLKRKPAKRRLDSWIAVLVFTLCCGAAMGWYARSYRDRDVQAQAQLMGRIDVLLMERYHALPGALREEVNRLYARMGFQGPGERK